MTSKKCGTDVNHAVLIVGYGVDSLTNLQYWYVKNSQSTAWGESGYARIEMTDGDGICGINKSVWFPSSLPAKSKKDPDEEDE